MSLNRVRFMHRLVTANALEAKLRFLQTRAHTQKATENSPQTQPNPSSLFLLDTYLTGTLYDSAS